MAVDRTTSLPCRRTGCLFDTTHEPFLRRSTLNFSDSFRDKRVLVTGDTGFKGAWLCEWLLREGADVYGIALPPETEPSLYHQLQLEQRMVHSDLDIRDRHQLAAKVLGIQPDFVFHLAAQPLVRLSYQTPVETFDVNVMGTIHLMDALRSYAQVLETSKNESGSCIAVMITTDKCYENREWLHGYREEDPMGGYDPYSASKGCAELAISSYRQSFFPEGSRVRLASARAGNVIGGGDWAKDRIVPDMVKALASGTPIPVRNKTATRPWQHVLEPLSGYLLLAARLAEDPTLAGAFNFGPALSSNRTVADLVQEGLTHWPGAWEDRSDPHALHEASKLNLATDKAFHLLGWSPRWNFETTIERTLKWYKAAQGRKTVTDLVDADLSLYLSS